MDEALIKVSEELGFCAEKEIIRKVTARATRMNNSADSWIFYSTQMKIGVGFFHKLHLGTSSLTASEIENPMDKERIRFVMTIDKFSISSRRSQLRRFI